MIFDSRSHLFTFVNNPGKKFCLIYLLVKRLLDQEPTFYQVEHDSAFLFCSQGVFSFRPSDFSGGRLKLACTSLGLTLSLEEGPLLLIGSSSSLSSLPSLFCRGYQSIFVVQAASPAPGGTAWLRESRAVRHVMNPWTWSEVVAGCVLSHSHHTSTLVILTSVVGTHFNVRPGTSHFFVKSLQLSDRPHVFVVTSGTTAHYCTSYMT